MKRVAALVVATGLMASAAPASATLVYVKGAATDRPYVWSATNGGHNPLRIGTGESPSIAPGGKSVVYEIFGSGTVAPRLMISPTDAARPRQLLSNWRGFGTLAWSPDASRIATVTGPELGTQNLIIINVATGVQRTIATGYFDGVSFSPSGDQIVYAVGTTENQRDDIYRADAAGGAPVALTTGHNTLAPLWGPKNIVYSGLVDASKRKYGPKAELFTMAADGSAHKRLTNEKVGQLLFGLTATAFSADGSRLLATFSGQDTGYADVVNPATGKIRALHGSSEQSLIGDALSRDGRVVLGETGGPDPGARHNVVTERYAGGKLTVLVRDASQADFDR